MGSIHIHTTFSGTGLSLYEGALLAQGKDLGVAIFADYTDRIWQYRWGIRLSRPSLLSKGLDNYLSAAREARKKIKGLVVLAGVEASPFYYWEGSPLMLTCRDYNRHVLVFGLKALQDYEDLPLLGNHKSGFDPFSGDQGPGPYQKLIDYANAKGALTFWAHPEQEDNTRFLTARLYTPSYPEILKVTDGYTGFSAFPRGAQVVACPGGYWDEVLGAYCKGKRKKPVWAIGESDYRREEDDIANPATVFTGSISTEEDVLRSLAEGRIWALDSPGRDLFLNYFGLRDASRHNVASMGETLASAGDPVTVRVDIESKAALKKVILIKDGMVIKEAKENRFELRDAPSLSEERSFYRLMAENVEGSRLLSNPVFVER